MKGMMNDRLDELAYYNQSNYSLKLKLIISVVLGIISLLLSPYGINSKIGDISIDIPWPLLFPILTSMTFGWRYGLVSALSGAALFPFLLWPENGWANCLSSFLFLSFFTSIGFVKGMNDSRGSRFVFYRYLLILLVFFTVFAISYLFLFDKLLILNSSAWQFNTIHYIEKGALVNFIIKDCINLVILTIFSDLLLGLPVIRLFFGLVITVNMNFNYKILLASLLICFFIWIGFVGLSYVLLKEGGFVDGHYVLALIVIITGGFVAARIIIHYTQRSIFAFEKMKESRVYLKLQFDKMPIAYIVWDSDLRVKGWNPAAEELFGYSENEVIGKSAYEIIVPKRVKEYTSKKWYDLRFKGIESQIINENIAKNGNTVICNWTNSPIKDRKGNISEVISMIQDITDQVNAKKTLKESNELLSLFIRNSPIYTYIKEVSSLNNRVLFASDNFTEMIGLAGADMVGKAMNELFPKEFAEKLISDDWAVVSNGQVIKFEEEFNHRFYSTIKFPISLGERNLLAGYTIDITERKQAEEMLKESETNLNSLINNRSDAIWSIDKDYNFIILNTFFKKEYFSNYQLELKKGMNAIDVIVPDLKLLWKSKYDLALTGQRVSFEFSAKAAHGIQFYEVFLNPIISDNTITGVSALSVNITERKQTEIKLQESEKSYSGLFNSVNEAIFIQDEKGYFLDINAGAERMYGYSRDEIIGKTPEFLSALGKNDIPYISELIDKTFATGEPQQFEFWGKRKNGEVFPKDVVSNKGNFFGRDVIITAARDISQRKQIERELQESEFFFKESQRAAFIGSYKADFFNGFWESSEVLDQIFGIDRTYIRSIQGWIDIVHPDDKEMMEQYLMEDVIAKRNNFNKEYRIKRKYDGKTGWVLGLGIPCFDVKGNIISLIGTIQDITERKMADELIRESKANMMAIIENTLEGIWAINTSYEILYVNEVFANAFMTTYGIKLESGVNILNFIPDSLRLTWKLRYDRAFSNERFIFEDKIDIGTKHHYFEVSVNPILFDGKVTGASFFSRDITNRKLAEEALKLSEERFKAISESADEWIWEVDKNGLYTFSNLIVEKILGYRPDEIVGKKHFFDFFDPESKDQLRESAFDSFSKMLAFKDFENVNIHKNGDRVIFKTSGSPILDIKGGLAGYRGVNIDITTQKRIEIALLESEEKYRLTFITSPDSVNINKMDGTYIDINEGFTRLTGYTREDVIGLSSMDIDIWHYPEHRQKLVKELKKNGYVSNLESVFRCKYGTLKTALMSARIIQINNTPHILSITRDITERKLLEDAIVKSEEKYRKLFERSNDAIFLIDKKTGKYLDANKATERITGYSLNELKNLTTNDITPIGSKIGLSRINKINKTINLGEIQYFRPDGTSRVALISVIPLGEDIIYGIAHDITDRKQYEDALTILSNIVEQSPVSILVTDTNGLIEYVNPKFEEITGYKLEEVIGKNPNILKSGYTSKSEYINLWKTITSGNEWRGEFYNKKKNGDKFWESVLISPITNENGKITHYLAVKENITEKKESERKILLSIINTEEKERNRFSKELHDGLGPLLSTIKLYFQWLSETEDSEKKKIIIEKGDKNLNEAIEAIREISNNLSPRTLSSFGVIVALRNFIENVNHTQKIFIGFKSNTENRFEKNVETVMYRVTTELINNTLKYANASKSEINILYNENDKLIRLTYLDNGNGFNTDEILNKGKGLGLVNIEQRVNSLDGKFKVESSLGKGVFVEIELPISNNRINV